MDDLEKFRALVLEDPDLQKQLLAVEAAEPFAELVASLAQERGLEITTGDVRWALQDARASWSERIRV